MIRWKEASNEDYDLSGFWGSGWTVWHEVGQVQVTNSGYAIATFVYPDDGQNKCRKYGLNSAEDAKKWVERQARLWLDARGLSYKINWRPINTDVPDYGRDCVVRIQSRHGRYLQCACYDQLGRFVNEHGSVCQEWETISHWCYQSDLSIPEVDDD